MRALVLILGVFIGITTGSATPTSANEVVDLLQKESPYRYTPDRPALYFRFGNQPSILLQYLQSDTDNRIICGLTHSSKEQTVTFYDGGCDGITEVIRNADKSMQFATSSEESLYTKLWNLAADVLRFTQTYRQTRLGGNMPIAIDNPRIAENRALLSKATELIAATNIVIPLKSGSQYFSFRIYHGNDMPLHELSFLFSPGTDPVCKLTEVPLPDFESVFDIGCDGAFNAHQLSGNDTAQSSPLGHSATANSILHDLVPLLDIAVKHYPIKEP